MAKTKKSTALLFPTWEAFCEATGRDPKDFGCEVTPRGISGYKLAAMILHCNGGKLPDYSDSSTWKYEPWWKIVKDKKKPSGLGLSYDDYGHWHTDTSVGPRFAFLETDHLEHMVEHFLEDYENWML